VTATLDFCQAGHNSPLLRLGNVQQSISSRYLLKNPSKGSSRVGFTSVELMEIAIKDGEKWKGQVSTLCASVGPGNM